MSESPEEAGFQHGKREAKRYVVDPIRTARPSRCRYCPELIVWFEIPPNPLKPKTTRMPLAMSTLRRESDGTTTLEAHWGNCPGAGRASKDAEDRRRRADPF